MTDRPAAKPPAPRIALVTGGARGIGAAICRALAADGVHVAVNYRGHEDDANDVVAVIRAAGGVAEAIRADVAVSSSVESLVEAATARLGPVTTLVNNAALTDVHKPWREITEEEWDRVMAVNLKSCFLCFRAVYPAMQAAQWGRVINISSVTFLLGRPDLLHYVASKAGMIGFTRTLAREVGGDGITVNAVTPGAIQTESELELFPDQAGLAAWLRSEQAVKR
ncbi:MAG TPA: SDR family NAD(P)-dependent oxidoreductase, partial [Thermomicrobiales bacterium]|nr:SDR family NAD(P)-dependent oxidoreductase [Thermomicrobiales bacterium]